MSAKDGGPAFPHVDYDRNAAMNGVGVTVTDVNNPGMTLRDFFAAFALAGMANNIVEGPHNVGSASDRDAVAADAYALADAMLKARNER